MTSCTAINYGALELGEDSKPRYKDVEKCIECGSLHLGRISAPDRERPRFCCR